ncbi:MAG: AsmA family protein, partial [Streptosporangiaceae bacterium]
MVLVAIPVVVPWITLPRLRTRTLLALQTGLGRGVSADAVHLQIFPRPGIELEGVRLEEDPAFGLEEMVVAQDATATLRWLPLLRGRLVFAGIHLDQASINLVRTREGRWNISALLDRDQSPTRSSGVAGAAGQHPVRPQFPYLEWSDARVNFKLEQTKTRFYLDQVEGSLVRESADWRLRARFQPERTDLNLSNTGELDVDGRWAAAVGGFRQAPFDLTVDLQNSYLAGSSALLAGRDAGVHGIVSARLHLHGTAQRFQVEGTAQAQALRRWDLLPPPATVACQFAGAYYPGEDRFELTGAGDPGWRHLRLSG